MFNRDRVFRLVRPRGERGRLSLPPPSPPRRMWKVHGAVGASRGPICNFLPRASSSSITLPRVTRPGGTLPGLYKISPRGGGRALMNYRVRAARSLKLHGEPRGAP